MLDQNDFICSLCSIAGDIDMDACLLKEDKRLLAEDENGVLMCLICYMKQANECLHCGQKNDLLPSYKCRNEPWLCEECLNLPNTVHVAACYSDGCMTPEEFLHECYIGLGDSDRTTLV
jgi:hypothetical protein